MEAIHERFHDLQMWVLSGDIEQCLCLGSGQSDGFFAKHMLSCLQRLNRPWNVQVIGQGIVNGINIRICEQFFIGTIGFRDTQLRRRTLRFF